MSTSTTKLAAASCLIIALLGNAEAEPLRDPTRPPMIAAAAVDAVVAPLRVEAIFRQGDQFKALVDGKLVRVGDRIGNATIQSITSDSVHFSRAGRSEIARIKTQKMNVRRSTAAVEEET